MSGYFEARSNAPLAPLEMPRTPVLSLSYPRA